MLVTSDEAPIPTGSPDAPETAIPDNAPFPEGHALLHSIQDSAKKKQKKGFTFKGRHSLIINERTLTSSIYALRFGVFADAVNSTILQPNFPFLVVPDLFKDSFPSTEPFGQAAAMYFLPMTAFLGTSISSTFIRYLSDKQGRRPWILACLGVGAIGSVVKYLVRGNFWTFCDANFVNELFGASLPVAMVYVSDVKNSRKEKDEEIGYMISVQHDWNRRRRHGGHPYRKRPQHKLILALMDRKSVERLFHRISLHLPCGTQTDAALEGGQPIPVRARAAGIRGIVSAPKCPPPTSVQRPGGRGGGQLWLGRTVT